MKKSVEEKYKSVIERLTTEMNNKRKCLEDISTLSGVSNLLTVLSITEFGFELSKQELYDSMTWLGIHAIHQHLVLAVANLIFSTV